MITTAQVSNSKPVRILSSADILMAPRKVIQRMDNIVQKYGREKALKSNSFQKAREAWVTSVFMLGLSQRTSVTYWIEENPIPQDDPDLSVYSYRNPSGPGEIGVVKEIQPVEVCEYPPQGKLGLVEHIKNKLKNKYYHPETILICYIHRPGEAFKLIDIINGLDDLQTQIREVWLLYHLADQQETDFSIGRVYLRGLKFPEMFLDYHGNYAELCKIPQPEFLKDHRGVDKTVTVEPLKEFVIVPLPSITENP